MSRSTFGNKAPSEQTVYNWFAEFRCGRASVIDEFRKGRPKLLLVSKTIDNVLPNMIYDDQHVK